MKVREKTKANKNKAKELLLRKSVLDQKYDKTIEQKKTIQSRMPM